MDRETVKEAPKEEKRRRTPGRRRRVMQLLAMTVCLVVMVAVMYGGMTLYMWLHRGPVETMQGNVNGLTLDENGNIVDSDGNVVSAMSGDVVYTQEELDATVAAAVLEAQSQGGAEVLETIRLGLSEGSSVVATLRPLYPDHIIVYSNSQYHFVPVNYNLALSQLASENLNVLESGEIQYMADDGQIISHKGIDVSKFQGSIDWSLVAQDGVEFAIIRVGNRGFGASGTLMEDDYFDANIQGALAAGIKVGVYFYSQAITEEELLEEADLVLRKIAPYNIECPVVFDVEKVTASGGGRMNEITVEERTHLTQLFCQTIEAAGYHPMIYHNTEMAALMLDLTALEDYDKWFAAYTDTLYYPYEYKIWQYSDTGSVQGISGDVDLNICFEPLWDTD